MNKQRRKGKTSYQPSCQLVNKQRRKGKTSLPTIRSTQTKSVIMSTGYFISMFVQLVNQSILAVSFMVLISGTTDEHYIISHPNGDFKVIPLKPHFFPLFAWLPYYIQNYAHGGRYEILTVWVSQKAPNFLTDNTIFIFPPYLSFLDFVVYDKVINLNNPFQV